VRLTVVPHDSRRSHASDLDQAWTRASEDPPEPFPEASADEPQWMSLGPPVHEQRLQIDVEQVGETILVRISGVLDLVSFPPLVRKLDSALAHPPLVMVVVDLTRVEFLGRTGSEVLVAAHDSAQARGRSLVLVADSPRIVARLRAGRPALPVFADRGEHEYGAPAADRAAVPSRRPAADDHAARQLRVPRKVASEDDPTGMEPAKKA